MTAQRAGVRTRHHHASRRLLWEGRDNCLIPCINREECFPSALTFGASGYWCSKNSLGLSWLGIRVKARGGGVEGRAGYLFWSSKKSVPAPGQHSGLQGHRRKLTGCHPHPLSTSSQTTSEVYFTAFFTLWKPTSQLSLLSLRQPHKPILREAFTYLYTWESMTIQSPQNYCWMWLHAKWNIKN